MILKELTEFSLSGEVVTGVWGFALPSLVDSFHAELVGLAFCQILHLELWLGALGVTVLHPFGWELVLALNNVTGDGSTTITLWGLPLQFAPGPVIVFHLWFPRLAWRIWRCKVTWKISVQNLCLICSNLKIIKTKHEKILTYHYKIIFLIHRGHMINKWNFTFRWKFIQAMIKTTSYFYYMLLLQI